MQPEDALQCSIAQYLSWQFPALLWWHTPNGGSRNVIEASKLKRMGVKAGVPDIFIPMATDYFKGFFCELKAGKNKLTPIQKEVISDLLKNGYYVCVCYSLEEFREHFEQKYLGKNHEA